MNKCTKCGYVNQPEDESAFTPTTECPKCHAIYEKVESWRLLKREYEKAEECLTEKERGQSRDGKLSDPRSSSGIMKKCPYCAEEIKPDAVKCRYCGEWLNQKTTKRTVSPVKSKDSDSLNFKDKILSKWERMSLGAKALTVLLVICIVGIIMLAIGGNNQKVSSQKAIQKQSVNEQAVQTQARVEAEEADSQSLLRSCIASCSGASTESRFIDRLMDDRGEERRCRSKCEQDALTRNIEIRKLREMQKQR